MSGDRFVRYGENITYTHNNTCPDMKNSPCIITIPSNILGTVYDRESYPCDMGCGTYVDTDEIIAHDPDLSEQDLEQMGIDVPADVGDEADLEFGGEWTTKKLDMLEKYLDAYTTALKNQPFHLIYIDAFAGIGQVKVKVKRARMVTKYIRGSVTRALRVSNKPFDELIFIEKDHDRYIKLKSARQDCDRCKVVESDANQFIESMERDWDRCRGVLFLDPFGAEVDWSTIERIAGFNALDTWILYPTSAITRLLPKHKIPDEILGWSDKLNRIFGGDDWRSLYHTDPQQTILGGPNPLRENAEEIVNLYKKKLKNLFKNRFLDESYLFKKGNSVLFEFIFCVGHPRGIGPAKRIAKHILTKPENLNHSS